MNISMLNLYLMAQLNKEAVLYLVKFDTYTDVYCNIKSASGIYGALGPGQVLVQKVEILDQNFGPPQTKLGRTT